MLPLSTHSNWRASEPTRKMPSDYIIIAEEGKVGYNLAVRCSER